MPSRNLAFVPFESACQFNSNYSSSLLHWWAHAVSCWVGGYRTFLLEIREHFFLYLAAGLIAPSHWICTSHFAGMEPRSIKERGGGTGLQVGAAKTHSLPHSALHPPHSDTPIPPPPCPVHPLPAPTAHIAVLPARGLSISLHTQLPVLFASSLLMHIDSTSLRPLGVSLAELLLKIWHYITAIQVLREGRASLMGGDRTPKTTKRSLSA